MSAVDDQVVKLSIDLIEARQMEAQMIAECVTTKSSMPTNYWHPRWHLEQRLRAAKALRECFT